MPLTLTVLRCPDTVTPETRTITGGEFSVGRGPGVDWVLTDPKNLISRRHFTVVFRSGAWRIIDESSNGTFANHDDGPIGKGGERDLRDHDRLRVGPYEIEVHLREEDIPRQAYSQGYGGPASIDAFDDPFADPLRPTDAGDQRGGLAYGFSNRTQEDHSSVLNDAIRPAQAVGHMPLHTGGLIPSGDLLSEDWEKDLLEGMSGATPAPSSGSPDAYVVPVAEPMAAQPVSGPADASLLDAFLAGVGLPDARPSDPVATFRTLGEAFRALVTGLRAALIARASVKSEFRIEQTMIRARGNNPLKFASDDDDAVSALLGAGRRSDMAPAAAIADALRDMRLHELASMAAMQSAIRALMEGLDPEKVRLAAEHTGGLLPSQRKARAWDAYTALYTQTSQALSDDFDSVFGKAFARAYEEALDELAASERS